MTRFLLPVVVFVALMLGCKKTEDPVDAQPKTLSDVLTETASFSLLRAAVTQAGMADALKGAQLTLFAPTDDAFKAAGFATPESLKNLSIEQLKAILRYHLVSGLLTTKTPDLASATNIAVQSSSNRLLYLTNNANGLFVNGNRVLQADREVANGFLHTIGKVMLPPAADAAATLRGRTDLALLNAAVSRAAVANPELLRILSGTPTNPNLRQVTIFAPTDAAFVAAGYRTAADINAAQPATIANLLTYHVVSGLTFSNQLQAGQLTTLNTSTSNRLTVALANNVPNIRGNRNTSPAQVKEADVVGGNAVIHVIDQVLQP
jgi:uncharacterized surface protein with fasciclin (FAS1) repeats